MKKSIYIISLILGVGLIQSCNSEPEYKRFDKGNSENIKESDAFSGLDMSLFESELSPSHGVFISPDHIFISLNGGEGSFISLTDKKVEKTTKYTYLDSSDVALRYLDSLWVLSGGNVEFHSDVANGGEKSSGGYDVLKEVTFEDVYYFDRSSVVIVKADKVYSLTSETGSVKLVSIEKSSNEILGAGRIKEGGIWYLDKNMEVRTLDKSNKIMVKLPSMPESGIVKGVVSGSSFNFVLEGKEKKYVLGELAKGLKTNSAYSWEKVSELADLYCIRCHPSDGLDVENTWLKVRKGPLLNTLKSGSMPPDYSDEGKKIQDSEVKGMIAWLEADGASVSPDPETPTEPDPEKPKRTDSIPTAELNLVQEKCASCHSTITTYGYWYDRTASGIVQSEVESGSMPKGAQTLSNAQKDVIIKFANSLK